MINSYCMMTTVKDIRNMDRGRWLDEMVKAFPKVHDSDISDQYFSYLMTRVSMFTFDTRIIKCSISYRLFHY